MKKQKREIKNKRKYYEGPAIAEFIGYQEDPELGYFPMFNIRGNHPKKGSTVDGNAVIRDGIAIPTLSVVAKSLESWKEYQKDLKRLSTPRKKRLLSKRLKTFFGIDR